MCDCGEDTAGGNFKPGHDQRLRSQLEQKVGGLLNLKELVNSSFSYSNGDIPLDDFRAKLEEMFG
jgi:hypothetical protein